MVVKGYGKGKQGVVDLHVANKLHTHSDSSTEGPIEIMLDRVSYESLWQLEHQYFQQKHLQKRQNYS